MGIQKVKVAVYAGAFHPPTLGHLQVAKIVLDSSKTFDEVWFMPCYKHMYGKNMTSPEHRLEMAKLLSKNDGRIKVYDYEIKNKLSGETYYLLQRLIDEKFAKDEYDFSFIIGMDNANNFHKWVNYEHLEKLARFVVIPRTGIKRNESVDWYLKSPHIYIATEQTMEISSTQVRNMIANDDYNVENYVDKEVLEYIKKNNLYDEN